MVLITLNLFSKNTMKVVQKDWNLWALESYAFPMKQS